MAEDKVDLLMSVNLDASDTLKEMAKLRMSIENARAQQKSLDKTTAEGRVEFERLGTQIKANSKTLQEYDKAVVNSIKQKEAQEGSIKSMRAELSNTKAAYAELSKAERESAKGKELLDKTAALNAELKELETAYGDNQRKVGDYELATKSLSTELNEITQNLYDLAAAGAQNSDTYKELSARAIELKNAQNEVNQTIGNASKDTAAIESVVQSAQGVTAAYGLWKSTSAALGIENEALDKSMQQLTIVMTALQSLMVLQNIVQKQSNVYRIASNLLQKIGIKQTTAETVATTANAAANNAEALSENASTVAKTKGVVATKLATAAQWLWNAAMNANPAVLLVTALLALVAGVAALVGWLTKESKASKDAKAAQEEYNKELEASEARLKNLEEAHKNHMREVELSTRKTIDALKAAGKSEKEIRDAQYAGATKLRELEIEHHKQRRKESEEMIALKQKELQAWITAQSQVKEGSKQWKKYAESIKEAQDALEGLKAAHDDADFAIRESLQDQIEANREKAEADKQAVKDAIDSAISRYENELQVQRRYNEAFIKAEKDYQNTDLRSKQEYARRVFDLNEKTERARLDNLRKYNRITEAEYKRSLEVMTADLTAFHNAQVAELSAFFESERKAIVGMITQTIDEQITETETKYAAALERLGQLEGDAALDNLELAIRLEEEKNAEIQRLRAAAAALQIKQIEEGVRKTYAEDLAMHQDNERKKLEITEASLREQIEKKKAAGLEAYDEEAQLRAVALRRNALDLNKELLLAEGNAQKIYDAKVKALNAEKELYADNADAQLEIARELASAENELIDARIESFMQWRDAASELFDAFNSLMSAGLDKQLQDVQDTYDKESQSLADKHAKGLLTEAQYNAEKVKLDQKKAKEEAKIERERAIRERVGKVFSVVTDTALGVVKAVSASPQTFGLPWSAFMAATGALNLATILSEPLPKAARGGLISGPLHAQGGSIIEAEGGEAVINRRSVSLFGPILSALNELGGGVPFDRPLSDGGFTLRAAGSSGATAGEIAEALKNVTIVTAVEDINRGQDKYAQIEARGSIFG